MKNFLASLAFLMFGSPMFAHSFIEGEFTYVTTSENTVELSVADVSSGDVVIPETVENNGITYTVTSIGESAFLRKSIISLEMPNTITRVGSNAFQFCMQMQRVHLSESLETIGASAFQTTRALTEINWPHTLRSINSSAFLYSTSFTGQIWLAKGVTVGDEAFSNMSKATSLYIDGQPTEWGNNVCEGCSKLTELYVNCIYPPLFDPSNTFPVDEWGWDDPVAMTLYVPVGAKDNYTADSKWVDRFEEIIEIEFSNPDTTDPSGGSEEPEVREYETYTDTWSDDYTVAQLNVAIPGTLSSLLGDHKNHVISLSLSGKLNGDDILCLRNMAGATVDGNKIDGAILKELDLLNTEIVPGGSPYYSYLDVHYTEQDAIGNKMFSYCYSLETFVMPKYAEKLGDEAFDHAEALKELSFNPTIKSIGTLAFYNCLSLEELDIPDSCSDIKEMAFYTCVNLKYVHLPASLTSIPFATFYFCHSLNGLVIPSGVKRIDNLAFQQCVSLTSINIPAATYMIEANSFGYCMSLTNFHVDADNMDYSDIDGVLFNKNKTKLLNYPIGKTWEIYEIPAGTVSAEENAMSNASFYELIIPEGMSSLGSGAAEYCLNLKKVHIPSTLTVMNDAFRGCSGIEDYYVADGNPHYADIDGVLCDNMKKILISYPSGRQDTEYVVPESIREIEAEAFREVEAIEGLTCNEGLETIKEYAFAYCESLKTAILPSTLQYIGEGAFGRTILSDLTCNAVVPPVCEYYEDEDGISQPFVGVDVSNCRLNVPQESLEQYKATPVWCMFNIMPVVGVESIISDKAQSETVYYDLAGRRVGPTTKGIVICRQSDGRSVKVIR